jgi:hypothetical protein
MTRDSRRTSLLSADMGQHGQTCGFSAIRVPCRSRLFSRLSAISLLSTRVTNLIDGGIAGPAASGNLIDATWSFKLYFVYFGLISLGIGSAIYQMRCPREVKKYADNAEFVLIHSAAVSTNELKFMADETVHAEGTLPAYYQQPDYRIPTMKNFYALKSHERPMSRLATTMFFFGGFALLAVPSLLTLAKVGRLLGRQILG